MIGPNEYIGMGTHTLTSSIDENTLHGTQVINALTSKAVTKAGLYGRGASVFTKYRAGSVHPEEYFRGNFGDDNEAFSKTVKEIFSGMKLPDGISIMKRPIPEGVTFTVHEPQERIVSGKYTSILVTFRLDGKEYGMYVTNRAHELTDFTAIQETCTCIMLERMFRGENPDIFGDGFINIYNDYVSRLKITMEHMPEGTVISSAWRNALIRQTDNIHMFMKDTAKDMAGRAMSNTFIVDAFADISKDPKVWSDMDGLSVMRPDTDPIFGRMNDAIRAATGSFNVNTYNPADVYICRGGVTHVKELIGRLLDGLADRHSGVPDIRVIQEFLLRCFIGGHILPVSLKKDSADTAKAGSHNVILASNIERFRSMTGVLQVNFMPDMGHRDIFGYLFLRKKKNGSRGNSSYNIEFRFRKFEGDSEKTVIILPAFRTAGGRTIYIETTSSEAKSSQNGKITDWFNSVIRKVTGQDRQTLLKLTNDSLSDGTDRADWRKFSEIVEALRKYGIWSFDEWDRMKEMPEAERMSLFDELAKDDKFIARCEILTALRVILGYFDKGGVERMKEGTYTLSTEDAGRPDDDLDDFIIDMYLHMIKSSSKACFYYKTI